MLVKIEILSNLYIRDYHYVNTLLIGFSRESKNPRILCTPKTRKYRIRPLIELRDSSVEEVVQRFQWRAIKHCAAEEPIQEVRSVSGLKEAVVRNVSI